MLTLRDLAGVLEIMPTVVAAPEILSVDIEIEIDVTLVTPDGGLLAID